MIHVCVIYHGTNFFNASITEYTAIQKGKITDYEQACNGKSGTDLHGIEWTS